jgi:YVTN family beta-propeller protein
LSLRVEPGVEIAPQTRLDSVVEFGILGPIEVREEGRSLPLGGKRPRALLALLTLSPNEVVSRDRLLDGIWGERPPATASQTLDSYVSRLRSQLGANRIERKAPGYLLRLAPDELDVARFEHLLEQGRALLAAGEAPAALGALDGALALWRGEALADIREEPFASVEAARLEERRLLGREERIDALLALTRATDAVPELESLVAAHPFRERLLGQLMLALYRTGRQADALAAYQEGRRRLAEEVGLEPSEHVRRLERQILEHDPALGEVRAPRVAATSGKRSPAVRGRTLLVAALIGVIAAAVAVPLFAFSSGGPRANELTGALGGNAVGAVSASTGRIFASVPLSASPDAITTGAGSIWAAMPDRGIVSRIDPSTNTVRQTISTPGGPSALAVGGGFVWVAETLAGTVTQVDPRANGGKLVGTIRVGNGPSGIAYGLGAVWVANSVDRTVIRIDPVTGTPGRPISVEDGADGVAAGDGSVWVIGQSAGVVSRIDPAARAVAGTTSVGNEPDAVAVGSDAVWVANGADGTVSKIDPSSGRLEGAFPVGKQPSGIAVAADGHVWVANASSATLTELDPATGHVIQTVPTGALPGGVAPDGETVYVAAQVPPSAHRGGTLRLAVANLPGLYTQPIPKEFDPASGYSAWELLTMTNDGLLGYSQAGGAETYKVVADLATGLPTVSDGGLTYTFQLRTGIRYSTGGVVRPADIRRGIERALLESGGQTPGSYLAVIEGGSNCLTGERCDLTRGITTSPGSSTVTFHLSKPDPDFLFQLALPDYDAVPASTQLHPRLPLPATGPYKIAGYQTKGVVELVRNPRFHVWSVAAQPDGYPDRIIERFRYTGASAIRAVEQGAADLTADGPDQTWPPALAASLQRRYSSQLYSAPELGILGLWLNTRLAPFNDVRVRQAFNLAVDRNRLVQINGGTVGAEVACQYLPPDVNGYSSYCPYSGPNLAKARRLVAESGTKGQPVTIWFYDIPVGRANGAYLVSVLRSIGYNARVELVPHDGRLTWRPDRQAGVWGWGGDYPSANDVLLSFLCSSYTANPETNVNAAELCDRRLDAQVARAQSLETSNPAAAAGVWHRIDRMLTDEAPWVPMKVTLSTDFVGRRVGNYRYCWLPWESGMTGACVDQLWVR